jgi:hypothetical protein
MYITFTYHDQPRRQAGDRNVIGMPKPTCRCLDSPKAVASRESLPTELALFAQPFDIS